MLGKHGLEGLKNAATRKFARALLVSAASSSPPLGQDLSELFALYAPPVCTFTPLPTDQQPRPLGMLKSRGEVHRDGDWHRSVHIWLLDEQGRLVLQKRSEHKDTNPGLLDVSCAGHITGNDHALETAVRELQEELGVTMTSETLEAAWVCTLPSTASGETTFGKFVCNEFQEIYIIKGWNSGVESLSINRGEVAGIDLLPADQVIHAWEVVDARFVPRQEHYQRVLRVALGLQASVGAYRGEE